MGSSSSAALLPQIPDWVARRPLTVAEYNRMAEVGILGASDRVELIDGAVINMSPIGSRHAGTVNALTRLLIRKLGDLGVVSVQNPVQLDDHNEPEPDLAVLRPRPDDYRSEIPRPEDVLLVIEIADTSARYDLTVKMPLYARTGIPELWIADLTAGVVQVCRTPDGETYGSMNRLRRGQTIAILNLPELVISVDDILG
jgi:Uma2 family endonuclease